jgi:endogenous inhibitor of DNA gyrase (YacG/DUF329 family)
VIAITCQECGTVFETYPSMARRRFCSRECHIKYSTGRPRGKYKPQQPPEHKTCEVCGTDFVVGGPERPNRKIRFCSLRCTRIAHRKPSETHVNTLSIPDAAYIAGIVDGEGCILFYKRDKGIKCRLTVSNTDFDLLEWLVATTGAGAIIAHKRASIGHSIGGNWQCHSETAELILRQIRPYLRVKAAQCDLVLDAQDRLRIPRLKADLTWQYEYADRMHDLNRRGSHGPKATATAQRLAR